MDGIVDCVAEELDFLLKQETGDCGLDVFGDDGCGGVCAVSRAECIVAVDVTVGRELLRHFGALSLELRLLGRKLFVGEVDAFLLVILLHLAVLSLVEARIFEQHHFARLESLDDIIGRHAVRDELDFLAELPGKLFRHRLKRERGIRGIGGLAELHALRTPEVRHEDERAAVLKNILNGRQSRHNSRIIGDFAGAVLGHRHVEIHTHNDALALEVNVA